MSARTSRWTRALSIAAIVGATLAPSALASGDHRSPDTIDAARRAHAQTVSGDHRSPDTIDAALAAHAVPPRIVIVSRRAFDWRVAGIGVVAGVAVSLVAAGALLLTTRARTRATVRASL